MNWNELEYWIYSDYEITESVNYLKNGLKSKEYINCIIENTIICKIVFFY